ncbi:MAG TPA: hypothetical protein VFJ72_06560 [Rubrobacteraceae bacterium]|nr:hypothetical protein [Rubrobacteraceae bacterium]
MQERNDIAGPAPLIPAPGPGFASTLLRVAWLAILLGLGMEGLLILLGTGLGDALGLGQLAADLVRNVSWSVFVCVGLAIGVTVAKARLPVAGLIGFLAAPVAFEVSRVVHRGALEALAATGGVSEGTSPFLIAAIKALEYGALGLAISWLGQRSWAGVMAHALTGLAVGLVFGGSILALTLAAAPQSSTADLISQAVNEVIFPVGCSLILFAANALGKRMAR